MSARRVRHDPTGLVDVLGALDVDEHTAVRAEVFARGTGGVLVLVRCRCGRLFDQSAIEDHLENPDARDRPSAVAAVHR